MLGIHQREVMGEFLHENCQKMVKQRKNLAFEHGLLDLLGVKFAGRFRGLVSWICSGRASTNRPNRLSQKNGWLRKQELGTKAANLRSSIDPSGGKTMRMVIPFWTTDPVACFHPHGYTMLSRENLPSLWIFIAPVACFMSRFWRLITNEG